ncbi:ATP-dependent Clp protease proteolytic subunit-related protein 4, chloroplastic [Phragmites australis]|uniref:ATP-dependent Clp protease proteolytic subunit-related protein 4, chloroplastic n=1 Tax=Phragmites australis TaxID=29695 RepID=UPI002D795667|nr:ATP-dependent Clp protease proteolytic subunit-related protein 4, chloroplastic [Phragmites australis]
MEAAAALSPPRVALDARALFSPPSTLLAPPSPNLRVASRPRALAAASKPRFLNPHPDPAGGINSRGARDVVAMVVPFLRGAAWEQPPPDLASFLYKNRIVYLGMCLVPSVTELMLAEFLYLQYEDAEKPIYLYINSTGTTKNGEKLGYETEALAVYDAMRYVKVPIFTLCVGNAWGEAALLLAAGAKGNRAALPSSTIMIKQPIGRFQGQATDVDIARKEIRNVKIEMVKLLSRHIGKPIEEIARDIRRPKYFSPSEAVDYGIIDKVLYNEKGHEDSGVVSELKRSNLI